jgi:hypothetical protein
LANVEVRLADRERPIGKPIGKGNGVAPQAPLVAGRGPG